jgi:SAM-dependent methyltransferase
MSIASPIQLNIGASQTRIPGFTNIDISPRADISIDLGKDRLPFENNCVDTIFTYHTLEHIPDYLFCLSEIHRVLKHGGHLLIGVPYVTLTEYNLVNPYHLHHFNEFSFDFFDPDKLKGSASEENPILFRKVFHTFHYMDRFGSFPAPVRDWCRRHLFNVVREIDFGLVALKRTDEIPQPDQNEMLLEFRRYFASRGPY